MYNKNINKFYERTQHMVVTKIPVVNEDTGIVFVEVRVNNG